MALLSLLEVREMARKMSGRVKSNKDCSVDPTILFLSMLLDNTGSCDKPNKHLHNVGDVLEEIFSAFTLCFVEGRVWWVRGWNPALLDLPGSLLCRDSPTNGAAVRGEGAAFGPTAWPNLGMSELWKKEDVARSAVGSFERTPGPWVFTSPSFGAPPSWI